MNGDPDERGASEIIGVVLLFGLVIAGTFLVLLSGGALKEDISQQNRLDSATVSMQELDAKMASMADQSGAAPTEQFEVTSRGAETVSIRTGDTLTISVTDDPACTATVPMDAIEYDLDDAGSVTYQAGGVFKTSESGTVVAAPPALSFRNGTLGLSVADLRGQADDEFTARKNVSASQRLSTGAKARLIHGADACRRPDGIELTVSSDRYHDVWAQYLSTEMPVEHPEVTVSHDPDDGTVTVELGQKALAEQSDDERNNVVDFTGPGGMGTVTDADGDGDREVRIDKPDDGNEYHASMTFLGAQAGHEEVKEDVEVDDFPHKHAAEWHNWTETKVIRNESKEEHGTPMEVVFLMDESGSMAQPCLEYDRHGNPWVNDTCTRLERTRLDEVKDATEGFLATLDRSDLDHRAALVGYTTRHHHYHHDYHDISADLSHVHSMVDSLDAEGGTPMGSGIWASKQQFEANHEAGHDKVIILLSDGKHNEGAPPLPQARGAANRDITIHTVGVGDDVNRTTLEQIANETGGEHHFVDDAGELEDVFNRLLVNETDEFEREVIEHNEKLNDSWTHVHEDEHVERDHRVVRTPVTLAVTVGDETRRPWVEGSTPVDRALNYQSAGAVPEGITVGDGETVDFEATVHGCDDQRYTGSQVSRHGTLYNFTVCSDAGSPIGDGEVRAYTDGTAVPSGRTPWWQTGLAETIPDRYVENTPTGKRFDLDSNQVIVVFAFDDDGGNGVDYNNAVFLFEAGKADEEITTDWLLNLQVNVVESDS